MFLRRAVSKQASSVFKSHVAGISTTANSSFGLLSGTSVLKASQFDKEKIEYIMGLSHEMEMAVTRHGCTNLLEDKVLCTAFFEPSTRTSLSFQAAMHRMGGKVLPLNAETSSVKKGETLEDTIRMVDGYSDAIVVRHPEKGSAQRADKVATIPILNAGDGIGEHPTQSLLDCYRIWKEMGTLSGLTVTLVGDLKYGRTVHSLAQMLSLYGCKLNYVSPSILEMPDYLQTSLSEAGAEQYSTQDLNSVIGDTDVLYVTRVQKERFDDLNDYEACKSAYIINNQVLSQAKQNMIVMHPLPRVTEIPEEVDSDPRAAYFRQATGGMYTRMALLGAVMGRL